MMTGKSTHMLKAACVVTLCFFAFASKAQTGWVNIGTGTNYNYNWDYPAPYGNAAYGAKHQMMIKASELTAAGAVAGPIAQLGFYVEVPSGTPLLAYTIKMGHTTATSLNSTFITGLTTVFGPATYVDVTGWNDHVLVPFVWNGTDNIVVETCFNNLNTTENAQMRYTTTSFSSCAYYYDWNTSVCASAYSYTPVNKRPNMRLFATLCNAPPTADFTSNTTITCVGGASISFTDQSFCFPTSWSWSFPGGTPSTSNQQNPTVSYSAAGTYDVTLTATNANGSSTITKTNYVTVNPICPLVIGTGTNYNSNTGYPAPYGNWYWGAKHQFLITAAELTAAGGSSGMIQALGFNVFQPQGTPLQGFNIKMGHTTLTALTSAFVTTGLTTVYGPVTYTETGGWNTHTFSTPFLWNGVNNVIVEVCFNNTSYTYNAQTYYHTTSFNSTNARWNDMSGVCSQTTGYGPYNTRPNMQITLAPCGGTPIADFTASPTTTCTGTNVQFNDLSACNPTSWSWTFQGGTPGTSTTQNPVVTYASAGTYSVTMTATNANGSDTETKTGYITVSSPCPVNIGTGTTTNSPYGYPAPYGNWYWGAKHQMLIKASEMIAAGGGPGLIQSMAFNVAVPQGTPLQGFTVKIGTTAVNALTGTFETSPLTTVYGPSTYAETGGWNVHTFSSPFYWNGTDNLLIETCFNNSSYTYNAQHYNTSTSFASTNARWNDMAGVCSQATGYGPFYTRPNMQFIIQPCSGPPLANFSASPTTLCSGGSVTFTDQSGCTPTSWSWSFPGGSPSTSNSQNPVVAYNTGGTYNVTLIATNANGSDTMTKTAYINVLGAPVANFTSNITVSCVGGPGVNFTDLSTNCPTSWSWTFQGGTPATSTAQNPTVTYSAPGTYDVTLVATNSSGTDTEVKTGYITVMSACPIIVGTGTTYNSQYGYPAPYGNWYWGAKHQLLVKASEIIANGGAAGMFNSVGFQVYIPQGVPLQSFYVKVGTTFLNALTTTFETPTWLGTYGPITYTESAGWNDHFLSAPFYWDGVSNIIIEVCFNNSSYTYNARHYNTNAGFQAVSYIYQDAPNVCSQANAYTTTAIRPNMRFYIDPCNGPPVVDFNVTPSTLVCTGSTVQFNDLSTCVPTSWNWSFPGGTPSTSSSQNPTVTYSTNGTYNVTLIAANANGPDTLTKTAYITVSNAPIPNFSASTTNTTVNIPIDFTDLSTCSTPTSWSWVFQGGTPGTSSAQNPTNIKYGAAGTYDVTLTVSNANGSNTLTKPDYITISDNMVVDPYWTVTDLIDLIAGPGVIVSNVVDTCHPMGRGYFAGGGMGISEGMIMSSGDVTTAPGPNNSGWTSTYFGYPGDAFLDFWNAQQGYAISTYDACKVDFDITLVCDSVQMTYVFGSEEYNEYVGASYNDIFGFFISGPGFSLPTNFAWVPNSSFPPEPISINTIDNGSSNLGPCDDCQFFVSNSQYSYGGVVNNSVQFDGYTTVLKSGMLLIPGLTYHVKLAIADGNDYIYNSAVMMAKDGFASLQAVACLVTLDVELVAFTGTALGTVNQLEWVTAHESNLSHYEVMRSYTGFDWEKIGEVDAHGSPSMSASYLFNDETFTQAVTYYRLNMVDNDGQQQTSNVVKLVNPNAVGFALISVRPLHDQHQVNVAFSSDASGPVDLTVCNVAGQVLWRQTVDAHKGLNTVALNIPDHLDLGVYMLGLNKSGESRSAKFVY